MRSIDESRRRLGVERFDILFLHDPDRHLREAENGALKALEELRSHGEVTAIGAA